MMVLRIAKPILKGLEGAGGWMGEGLDSKGLGQKRLALPLAFLFAFVLLFLDFLLFLQRDFLHADFGQAQDGIIGCPAIHGGQFFQSLRAGQYISLFDPAGADFQTLIDCHFSLPVEFGVNARLYEPPPGFTRACFPRFSGFSVFQGPLSVGFPGQ